MASAGELAGQPYRRSVAAEIAAAQVEVEKGQLLARHRHPDLGDVGREDRGQGRARSDELADVGLLAAHPSVVGCPHFGAGEVEPRLLERRLGGGQPCPRLGQLGLAPGQRAGLALAQLGPLASRQLGLRLLALEADRGLGHCRLRLGDRQPIVGGLDPGERLSAAKEPTFGELGRHPLDAAGDLGHQGGLGPRRHRALGEDVERHLAEAHLDHPHQRWRRAGRLPLDRRFGVEDDHREGEAGDQDQQGQQQLGSSLHGIVSGTAGVAPPGGGAAANEPPSARWRSTRASSSARWAVSDWLAVSRACSWLASTVR